MVLDGWKERAARIRQEVRALSLAIGDPRTPRIARLLAIVVVAYALSPIDLIPDPIPVVGYLDDVVLIPAGVILVLRLVPPVVMDDARRRAADGEGAAGGLGRIGAAIIVVLWLISIGLAGYLVYRVL